MIRRSYRMFEINMDEYLDEEVEHLKLVFSNICKSWDHQVSQPLPSPSLPSTHTLSPTHVQLTHPLLLSSALDDCQIQNRHRSFPHIPQPRPNQTQCPHLIHKRPPPPRHHRPTHRKRRRRCLNDRRVRRRSRYLHVKPSKMGWRRR